MRRPYAHCAPMFRHGGDKHVHFARALQPQDVALEINRGKLLADLNFGIDVFGGVSAVVEDGELGTKEVPAQFGNEVLTGWGWG